MTAPRMTALARWPLAVGALAVLASCAGSSALHVDLRTDLLPGSEFRDVRTTISAMSGTARDTGMTMRIEPGAPVHRGARVAEFSGLSPGLYRVHVELMAASGPIADASLLVTIDGEVVVTALITRSCVRVSCPGTGQPANLSRCLGGVCVDPECGTARAPECPTPQCEAAASCPPLSACAAPSCLEGVCFYELDHTRCPPGQNCHAELGCLVVPRDDASVPPDAGTADAPPGDATCPGPPTTEICNGVDDDCDGTIDDGFPLATDPANCGACGNACGGGASARPACAGGRCTLACNPGFGNCDGDDANGCEADLSSPGTCGSCTTSCGGATPACVDLGGGTFRCETGCMAGQTLCSGSCADTATSVSHCGGCGNDCILANATPACVGGACRVASCNAGSDNCDGMHPNGCEASLTSVGNCGMCGRACSLANASETCATGTCRIGSCNGGYFDVDGNDANGCECQDDGSPTCGGPADLGSIGPGGAALSSPVSNVAPSGGEDWYVVGFPPGGAGPAGGTPQISFSRNDGNEFRFDVRGGCGGGGLACGSGGSATDLATWSFTDDQSPGYTTRSEAWPASVLVRVFRVASGASCASYRLQVTR